MMFINHLWYRIFNENFFKTINIYIPIKIGAVHTQLRLNFHTYMHANVHCEIHYPSLNTVCSDKNNFLCNLDYYKLLTITSYLLMSRLICVNQDERSINMLNSK